MRNLFAKAFITSFVLIILGLTAFESAALNNHWENLGGNMQGSPSIASWADDRRDVFARGEDNQIYWKFYNGSTWSSWTSIGGQATSAPDCVAPFPGRLDCVVNGPENTGVFHNRGVLTGNGMLWSGWEPLGGLAGSGPTIASLLFTDGHIELQVFVRGPGDTLWTRRNNGTVWGNWINIPGTLHEGDPDCVYKGLGEIDCVMRNLDDNLVHNEGCCLNTAGVTLENLGGLLLSGPTIASWGTDHLGVAVRGPGNTLWTRTWNGNIWSDWTEFDDEITLSSAPDCTAPSPGNWFCVITDANGNVLFDNLLVM